MEEEFDEADEINAEVAINNVLVERSKRTEKDVRSYVS
jgi:hypothetical protein